MSLKACDWNLLTIAAAAGEPLDPAQLQKTLFLLGQRQSRVLCAFYAFMPYHYGPFDRNVYTDAEQLADAGLVHLERSGRWTTYAATPAGIARARQLETEAPAHVVKDLHRLVEWARGLSFQELVRAVYAAFPEMRANSVFRG